MTVQCSCHIKTYIIPYVSLSGADFNCDHVHCATLLHKYICWALMQCHACHDDSQQSMSLVFSGHGVHVCTVPRLVHIS